MNVSSSLTCDSNDNNQITLQWTPPTNTSVVITHYELTGLPQYATCSPGPCDMINDTNTTLTGLQCNTSYMVSVRAVSDSCAGNGTFSDPIEILFHPKPIATITAGVSCSIGIHDHQEISASFILHKNKGHIWIRFFVLLREVV